MGANGTIHAGLEIFGKEYLIPSLVFAFSFCLLIFYPFGFDINLNLSKLFENSIFLLLLFLSFIILLYFTNNLEAGRKFRKILLRVVYHNEYQKGKMLKRESKIKKQYSHIYDKKFNKHMRDEVNKLDNKIVLFTNLALVSVVLFVIDVISLVFIFTLVTVTISKLIFNFIYLIVMPLSIKYSRDICGQYLVMLNDTYIQYLKEDTDDFL